MKSSRGRSSSTLIIIVSFNWRIVVNIYKSVSQLTFDELFEDDAFFVSLNFVSPLGLFFFLLFVVVRLLLLEEEDEEVVVVVVIVVVLGRFF